MVAPIVGTLKKKIITDITVGFALGGLLGGYWWYGPHNERIATREKWYADYEKTKNDE